jgi:hypothetical protein
MSERYCACERPEGFAGSLEWRTPVHAACGKPNRETNSEIQESFEYHDEGEISASVVEKVLRRDAEGEVVHTNLADLRKVEREGTSNRLNLPLPDGYGSGSTASTRTRSSPEHPDEVLPRA